MEDNHMEENEQKLETEVAPALIAVHPSQISVSVSVGSELRVFSLQDGSRVKLVDETGGHKDSIRAIRYSRSGQLFVSGDCNYENTAPVNKKAVPVLSHYCSIITRLEFSPDGKYIITADRDFKIRVTVFPKQPLNGAHEIQSFCLGHTEFVSCLAFISCEDYAQGLLVSGSGDSTVRLWDYASGCLLDTCDVGAEVEGHIAFSNYRVIATQLFETRLLHSNQRLEEVLPAITDLCATADGSLVAVAVQSLPGIMLLGCSFSARTLSVVKVVSVEGETFIPTSIGVAPSFPLLWMVMGASSLQSNDSALLARVRAVSGFTANTSESTESETSVLEDTEIPGGEPLLQALQGKLSIGEEAFSTAAEAVKTAMRNLLIKKQYSAERREFRKRGRNDKKNQTPA
ncbi:UNVERIFIED_CONTAM: tRNA (guanine-N(7)-)-methyltransferase non-catalytic subunit wdr4 [Sesamum angustifolium]|uniref:tRNA (Guanine-N(7)-)-methyltransferase non-catalytic subunit wdr4 n=1 Tax=Sesamum angustifolium TaxID=2727405 RepID=A0AAW2QU94_9LAMI